MKTFKIVSIFVCACVCVCVCAFETINFYVFLSTSPSYIFSSLFLLAIFFIFFISIIGVGSTNAKKFILKTAVNRSIEYSA